MTAFVTRLSGLREIVARLGTGLGTNNFSSLSHALSRPSTLSWVRSLVEHLEARHTPRQDELIALDSMPLTLPITQRHRCVKCNRNSVGGGVLWEYRLQAAPGSCPVRILCTIAGGWRDAGLMKAMKLLARRPIYLMDRGFYAMGLIQSWNQTGVRFIVRAPFTSLYEVLGQAARPHAYGRNGWIKVDALVGLGGRSVLCHPVVRLIHATVGREHFVVATSEMTWTAAQVLDAYKRRARIERFHRFVKDTVGLAHLYSFSQTGLMVLLHVALLMALLLFMGEAPRDGEEETLAVMRTAFHQVRALLGLGIPWKRNTNAKKRSPHIKRAKWQRRLNP